MASLGELVAGVAHEINTPVGIGVTVASHLKGKSDELMESYEGGKLKKSILDDFVVDTREGVIMLLDNLERAAGLIQSFKQVAVDQSSENLRSINVAEYLKEVVSSLQPKLKRTKHTVKVEGVELCEAMTYPGALAQIVTNLVGNSLLHGFDDSDAGTIRIKLSQPSEDRLEIQYTDDGVGMDEPTLERVFNPFFTTKRGKGGSGLGMHIIYNLVTQSLKGTITCTSSPGEGLTVVMNFPRDIVDASESSILQV